MTTADQIMKQVSRKVFAPTGRKLSKGVPRTELAQTLRFYSENYGLAFNTIRRHRALLDDPRALFLHLIAKPTTRCSLSKLHEYIKANNL